MDIQTKAELRKALRSMTISELRIEAKEAEAEFEAAKKVSLKSQVTWDWEYTYFRALGEISRREMIASL